MQNALSASRLWLLLGGIIRENTAGRQCPVHRWLRPGAVAASECPVALQPPEGSLHTPAGGADGPPGRPQLSHTSDPISCGKVNTFPCTDD